MVGSAALWPSSNSQIRIRSTFICVDFKLHTYSEKIHTYIHTYIHRVKQYIHT